MIDTDATYFIRRHSHGESTQSAGKGYPMTTTFAGRLSSQLLRGTFGCFPSGVTAVCALVDSVPLGIVASSYTSVSMDPPLVSVCMGSTSSTWPLLRKASSFGINVLAEGQDVLCRQLAAKDVDRFAGIDFEVSVDGAILLSEAATWLECSIHSEVEAGDHSIVLFEIHEVSREPHKLPLVFHGSQFRQLAQSELAS